MITLKLILSLVALFIAALMALIPLARMHPAMLNFLRFLPPSALYRNALSALKELNFLDKKGTDEDGYEYWYSIVNSKDIGFRELVKVLKENAVLGGNIQEIRLKEERAGMEVGPSAQIARTLTVIIDDEEKIALYRPFDPLMPTRTLEKWVEEVVDRQLLWYVVILVIIWLVLNSLVLTIL